jgi:phage terminase small subunit
MSKRPSPRFLNFRTRYLVHGNATLAAKEARYKNPNVMGPRLASHPIVKAALQAKQGVALSHAIADRTERQKFWTQTMRDSTLDMQHRQKGSELLGKSEGDFIDRLEIESAQVGQILGQVVKILKSVIPPEFWGKVAEELAPVIAVYGNNNAGLS